MFFPSKEAHASSAGSNPNDSDEGSYTAFPPHSSEAPQSIKPFSLEYMFPDQNCYPFYPIEKSTYGDDESEVSLKNDKLINQKAFTIQLNQKSDSEQSPSSLSMTFWRNSKLKFGRYKLMFWKRGHAKTKQCSKVEESLRSCESANQLRQANDASIIVRSKQTDVEIHARTEADVKVINVERRSLSFSRTPKTSGRASIYNIATAPMREKAFLPQLRGKKKGQIDMNQSFKYRETKIHSSNASPIASNRDYESVTGKTNETWIEKIREAVENANTADGFQQMKFESSPSNQSSESVESSSTTRSPLLGAKILNSRKNKTAEDESVEYVNTPNMFHQMKFEFSPSNRSYESGESKSPSSSPLLGMKILNSNRNGIFGDESVMDDALDRAASRSETFTLGLIETKINNGIFDAEACDEIELVFKDVCSVYQYDSIGDEPFVGSSASQYIDDSKAESDYALCFSGCTWSATPGTCSELNALAVKTKVAEEPNLIKIVTGNCSQANTEDTNLDDSSSLATSSSPSSPSSISGISQLPIRILKTYDPFNNPFDTNDDVVIKKQKGNVRFVKSSEDINRETYSLDISPLDDNASLSSDDSASSLDSYMNFVFTQQPKSVRILL